MAIRTVVSPEGDAFDALRSSASAHLDSAQLVEQLVSAGASRLTAARIVEIERGKAEPGRARAHPVSRAR